MANTINYGRSGRGGKDPRKTLTSAQRRKASMDRRGKEEKESAIRWSHLRFFARYFFFTKYKIPDIICTNLW